MVKFVFEKAAWIWRKSTKSIFVVGDLKTTKIWGKTRRSQNFARTRTARKRGKYFAINQFIKGSTSGLVMKSYLNDKLEDKQCYFSLGYFSTKWYLNSDSAHLSCLSTQTWKSPSHFIILKTSLYLLYSLRKHPFLLALRRWGRFARNVPSDEERGETDVFAG